MTIRLLGPIEVLVEGEPLPRLRSRQGLRLLAYLALHRGKEIERGYLAGLLWPESTTDAGIALLRRALTDLRRALGSASPSLVAQGHRTLCLMRDPENPTDVERFERGLREGSAGLAEALELYRGPFLAGFLDDWVVLERERLQLLYLDGLERRAEQVGPIEASGLLRRVLALDPFREATVRKLMEAQAQVGDTAGVSACFTQLRRRMRRELGTDPDDTTHHLYRQLLKGLRQPTVPQEVLPLPLTAFLGRGSACETLARLLGERRLLTLTGPGGTGKTRLVLELAHREQPQFSGGVFFVPCAALEAPEQVLAAVARSVGARLGGEGTLLERLAQALGVRPGRTLLVLDNLEQLAIPPEAGGLRASLSRLLAAVPKLVCVTTSRVPLRVAGEQEFFVEPLGEAEGVALLEDRIRAQGGAVPPADALVALCRTLEGLPLALELAAGALRVLSVEELQAQLQSRLRLKAWGGEERPERHRSLRAVLEGSYRLLDENLQRRFAQLSAFRGGWSATAAAAVWDDPEPLEALNALAEHSLVRRESGRFRMLEVVREFAAECLSEPEVVRHRHAAHFLELAQAVSQGLLGPDQGYWHTRMDTDYENLQAALDNLAALRDAEAYLELVAALSRFWERRSYFQEAYRRCAVGLELHGDRPHTEWSARALQRMGVHCWRQGERERARQLTQAALAYFTASGNLLYQCDAHQNGGNLEHDEGNFAAARAHFEQGLALARRANDEYRIASLLGNLGYMARAEGQLDEAARFYEEQLALRRRLGDLGRVARSLSHLGQAQFLRGDIDAARRYYAESIALHRQFKNDYSVANDLYGLAELARREGNRDEARTLYEQARAGYQRVGVGAEREQVEQRLRSLEQE